MKHILPFILLFASACSGSINDSSDVMTLVESSKQISINIDSNTNLYCSCIRFYEDSTSEYLTIRRENPDQIYDELVFFDINKNTEAKSIKVYRDGPNAINGRLFGYDIISLDSIVLTSMYRSIFYILNDKGEIIKEVSLDRDEGATESLMLSSNNQPFIRNKNIVDLPMNVPYSRGLYRPNPKDFKFSDCPLAFLINLETGEIKKSKASFPHLYDNDDKIYHNETKSRVFDGVNYVYSFCTYDSLIVTTDYQSVKKFNAKSRYLGEVKNEGFPVGSSGTELMKANLRSFYGNMIYDKYRNVYYRICCFEHDYDGPLNIDYLMSGGAFSVMIINSDFQVVGETVFPAGKYAPKIFFVNKDGLWLSENNFQRDDMTDDVLVFRCLKLEEKK